MNDEKGATGRTKHSKETVKWDGGGKGGGNATNRKAK